MLLAVLTLVLALLIVGCDKRHHEHNFSVSERVAPTCVSDGYVKSTCSCGEIKTDKIDKTGEHVKGDEVRSVSATCTEKGSVTYACSVCGIDMVESVDATGHKAVSYEDVAPTCSESGYSGGSYCSECGDELEARTKLSATGKHTVKTYGTVAPTCSTVGYEGGTYCTECKTVLTSGKEVPATGEHTPVIDLGYDATCGVAGLTNGQHCSQCGEVLAEQTEIPALTHNYQSQITVTPEYMVEGELTYTCSNCGDSYTEVIPALDYDPLQIWSGSVADGFDSGDGSEADPYVIKTAEQLAYFARSVNYGENYSGKYIKLANDIILNDLATYNIWDTTPPANVWTPIGSTNAANLQFYGNFLGEGHSVRGIYSVGSNAGGLFGSIGKGSISGVSVTEAYIEVNGVAGGIVGHADGSDSTIKILECNFDGVIIATSHAGGIVGYARCGWYGFQSVSQRVDHYGYVDIQQCTSSGTVISDDTAQIDTEKSVGGIIGYVMYTVGGLRITECTNDASVTSKGNAGGIVGKVLCKDGYAGSMYVYLTSNTNKGDVYGTSCVGGIGGYVSVSSDVYGYYSNKLSVTYCRNTGNVTKGSEEQDVVGGLFGLLNCSGGTSEATLSHSYNTGDVTVIDGANAYNVGGLAGTLSFASNANTVQACFNSGDISSNCAGHTGGLIGYIVIAQRYSCSVDSCYNSGNVSSFANYVGGIAGYTDGITYTNVYNTGSISGASNVGGIFGYTETDSVSNCYNAGAVSGMGVYVGAICGQKMDSASVSYAYYLDGCATDGQGKVQGANGQENDDPISRKGALSAENMQWSSSYSGFDFGNTWYMPDDAENPYPRLLEVWVG